MGRPKKTVAKAVEVQAVETQAVVEKVKNVKAADVVASLSNLSVEVQKKIAGLTGDLSGALAKFDEVQAAIVASEARLQELFNVQAELLVLDEVVDQIQQGRLVYETERAERDAGRKRDEEEYSYSLNRMRKENTDKWNDEIAARKRSEDLRREQLERSWAEREAVLKGQEQEVASLRAQVANIPTDVDAAVKKAEAILSNVLKKHYETQAALLAKDAEGAAKLAEQTIQSLNATIMELDAQNDKLQAQLEAARGEVKEIAAKAVEAASGQQALSTLQNSLNVQANSTQRTGR